MIGARVSISPKDYKQNLRSIPMDVRDSVSEVNLGIAKKTAENMKKQLALNGTIWRGRLYDNIKARNRTRTQAVVTMPYYGIYLDSMEKHLVHIKRGRLIYDWAKEKGIKSKFITVKPHPFITKALSRTRSEIRPMLKREIKKEYRQRRKR